MISIIAYLYKTNICEKYVNQQINIVVCTYIMNDRINFIVLTDKYTFIF